MSEQRIISAQGVVDASASRIFRLIADPARQPEWDGNDNLSTAGSSPRVTAVDDVFTMVLTNGKVRENHVVEFAENELIAWKPSGVDQSPPGHLWRWEMQSLDDGWTRVTHTYDWTQLQDEQRLQRARSTTPDMLEASVEGLRQLAEGS
ncbi:MAG: polyketide cyclase [Nesterenkonia sp.]